MTLVVYADTLIVVTFLYGISSLILFGLICNYPIKLPNIVIAAMSTALLSTYILIQFLRSRVPFYLYLPFWAILLSVSIGIGYRFESRMAFFRGLLALFSINLAQAGVAIILLSVIAYRVKNWIFLYIASIVFAEMFVIVLLFRQNRFFAMYKNTVQLKIKGNNEELLRAIVDTGNILRDPLYYRPVILISPDYKSSINDEITERFEVLCFTVSGESMLEGGIISEVTVMYGKRERLFYNVPVAFSSEGFMSDGFGAIIPKAYAEGL